MSTIWVFDHKENKDALHHGKDCMKKLCTSLGEHTINTLTFNKKKMISLKKELRLHYKLQQVVTFV